MLMPTACPTLSKAWSTGTPMGRWTSLTRTQTTTASKIALRELAMLTPTEWPPITILTPTTTEFQTRLKVLAMLRLRLARSRGPLTRMRMGLQILKTLIPTTTTFWTLTRLQRMLIRMAWATMRIPMLTETALQTTLTVLATTILTVSRIILTPMLTPMACLTCLRVQVMLTVTACQTFLTWIRTLTTCSMPLRPQPTRTAMTCPTSLTSMPTTMGCLTLLKGPWILIQTVSLITKTSTLTEMESATPKKELWILILMEYLRISTWTPMMMV